MSITTYAPKIMPAWLSHAVLVCRVTLILAASAPAPSNAQTQTLPPVPPRLSVPRAQYYANHPAEWQQLMQPRTFVPSAPSSPTSATPPPSASWQSLTSPYPGGSPSAPMLLTDGTVLVHEQCSPNWYKLTPDNAGSYINGTWSAIATLPMIGGKQYAPLYFASAVLPDGRLIMNGGEYNNDPATGSCNSGTWSAMGAIYDPIANAWTAVFAAEWMVHHRRRAKHRANQWHVHARELLQQAVGIIGRNNADLDPDWCWQVR